MSIRHVEIAAACTRRLGMLLLGLTACATNEPPTAPAESVATIDFAGVSPILAADTARIGLDFLVKVFSNSESCVDSAATSIRYAGSVAIVVPRIRQLPASEGGNNCIKRLGGLEHRAVLRFAVAGASTVRVEAKSPAGSAATFEKFILVVAP